VEREIKGMLRQRFPVIMPLRSEFDGRRDRIMVRILNAMMVL
jgi:hypothetical protein